MRRIGILAAVAALAAALIPVIAATAATPSSGTVTPDGPPLSYQGAAISATPPVANRRLCVEGTNCDTFVVTASAPAGFYDSHSAVLTVKISWAAKENDLDLYVCQGDSTQTCSVVGSSTASNTTSETVTVANPSGDYRVIAAASGGSSAYD